ncbi:cytochrome b/b6 domain-containing protein [Marinobacter orientalis]|uniref:Cytochrome B n=1 Tax=Marinobacter orientalis TaxID=1928859 RepID=A0A7Y0REX4_9GAMM|nr:cytochrome b/b6 domain-containing protein [Marinobacter orientalis]NMT64963.1 cytochrome B [Marinobacter orientalis]TGX48144.1 cytochrome B [Marinobacter orientalis]
MNAPRSYSGLSTLNHWITALVVIVMLVLGFVAAYAPDENTEGYIMGVHVALGFFVFWFVLWRVAYRIFEGFPPSQGHTRLESRAAFSVQSLILLALVLQVITGPLYIFTEGEAIDVFGWFSVSLPLESLSLLHEPAESVHIILGIYVLPILIGLHFLGAVRHYLSKRQETPADLS